MKFVSLFAGIGGFDLALERLGLECVYANDIDKYCKIIYDRHFETKLDTRSIKDVSTTEIPEHDLLVGGFPCQAFSIAGKRRGFEDIRGTLFFDVARILRDKRPRYFILENVKGLLTHDGGKTFSTILEILSGLGYEFEWCVYNSKDFGVPQNRERIYIVGHTREETGSEILPLRESGPQYDESEDETRKNGERIRGQNISATIDANYYKGAGSNRQMIQVVGSLSSEKWDKFHESNRRVYSPDGISPIIPTSAGGGHLPKILTVIQDVRGMNKKSQNGKGYRDSQTSYTIDTKATQGILKEGMIRRLTPIECERLQGFPDNWTEGVSDTQRYKMCGNAVTVNVVSYVAGKLLRENSVK